VGATELHAAFREESRTSPLSTSAALQEIREATGHFVVFSQGKPHLAIFYQSNVIAKLPYVISCFATSPWSTLSCEKRYTTCEGNM
jgi:hypothetical protein